MLKESALEILVKTKIRKKTAEINYEKRKSI